MGAWVWKLAPLATVLAAQQGCLKLWVNNRRWWVEYTDDEKLFWSGSRDSLDEARDAR